MKQKQNERGTHRLIQREMTAPDGYTIESRAVQVEAAAEGPIRVVLSTDAPLPASNGGRLSLVHTPEAVDMSRAARGLPITAGHFRQGDRTDQRMPVARAMHPRIEDGRLVGELVVSAARPDLEADIRSGVITDLSVDAMVERRSVKKGDDGIRYAGRWQPISAAFTLHGADPEAGVLHQRDDSGNDGDGGESRQAVIQRMFSGLDGAPFLRLERESLYGDATVEDVQRSLNTLIAEQLGGTSVSGVRVQSGDDSLDKWADAVQRTLDFRAGLLSDDERDTYQRETAGTEFASMNLREFARDYLRRRNVTVVGTVEDMVQRALELPAVMTQRAIFSHATSDFSNLLAGTSDRSLGKGFMEADETYQRWAANVTLTSFRASSFPVLSAFGDLDEIPETGEFEYGTFTDKAEALTLKSWGKLFSIGRQAIINDDLGAFSRVPMHMGRAAARKVGDLVYAVLTGNPTMAETGRALFNTTDKTLAASAAALSVATLDIGHTAMGKYTDPAGNVLNLSPRYLIVPRALRTTAKVLVAAEKDPAGGAGKSEVPNPFRDEFDVISDSRLDADSAISWYMVVGPNAGVETISVGWLNGMQRPRLQQEAGFERDGIAYKVAIDCVAGALDYRCGFKNAGA